MSNPETNLDKQKRRHWGPLVGIAAVLILVTLLGFVFLADGGDDLIGAPEPPDATTTQGTATEGTATTGS